MVDITSTTSCVHILAKHLDVKCGPLSARTPAGTPNLLTQCSTRTMAAALTLVIAVSMGIVIFKKVFVALMMYWLPLIVLDRGPSTSTAKSVSGSFAKNITFVVIILFAVYGRMTCKH